MPFERPLTIEEAIKSVEDRKYLLPAIQREFVWGVDQVEKFFDSIMRKYPIGTFLFWYVEKSQSRKFQFYEFIRNYHEKASFHNKKIEMGSDRDITAVLDGQQRLTALYLGLKGTYAEKLKGKRWENPDAFPVRKLYLNLLSMGEGDCEYIFKFLTEEEAAVSSAKKHWFRVGEILDFQDEYSVSQYVIDKKVGHGDGTAQKLALKTIFTLREVIIKEPNIHYFLEKDEKLDKVLDIFIRVNSGGTQLSYSDLLLSIATAEWKSRDAREEITRFVDEINNIGSGFNIDKDFVLKTCLVLCDFSEIAFKVDNFNAENMAKIESCWDRVTSAIRTTFLFAESLGFNRDNLPSNVALMPICYYIYKNQLSYDAIFSSKFRANLERMHQWLLVTLLKRTYSGTPDNVLRPIRQVLLEDLGDFPFDALVDKLRGGHKSVVFNEDDIDNLLLQEYGTKYAFATLALLYPMLDYKNKFHQDHIFAKSFFTIRSLSAKGLDSAKCEWYLGKVNQLPNLQLMEGPQNLEKSDTEFKNWFNEHYPDGQRQRDYMEKHYIPSNVDCSLQNFEKFFIARARLMRERLVELLQDKNLIGVSGRDEGTNEDENEEQSVETNLVDKVSSERLKEKSIDSIYKNPMPQDKYWEAAKKLVGKTFQTKRGGSFFEITGVDGNLKYKIKKTGSVRSYPQTKIKQFCDHRQNGGEITIASLYAAGLEKDPKAKEYTYAPTIIDEIIKVINLG